MKIIEDKDIKELIHHPEVIRVNNNQIEFSNKFRNKYLDLIQNLNYSPKQALRNLGINPYILGETRVNQLKNTFKQMDKDINQNSKYRFTVYKNPQEELEFYKRYSYRLEHALKLYLQIYKIKTNFKEIEKILKN